jgi:NAD(P)-dependent dehydrogenase (short-subunit alcohol dehydrogenase family)
MTARTVQQLFDLTGKTALVTGGSRGLGLQMAHALGEAGARIMLSSRKAADLEEAVADLQAAGIDARWIAADCAVEADIRRLASETLERMGRWTSWSTTPVPPGARPPKTIRWRPGTRS